MLIREQVESFPLTKLAGVGPQTLAFLQKLGITSIEDLLFYLPIRYQDRTRISPIGLLREGDRVLIEGQICSALVSGGRKPSLLCQFSDSTGNIQLRFFHFNAQQKIQLSQIGLRLRCFGEVRRGYYQGLELIHPEYRLIYAADELPLEEYLTPIYPSTQGLSQSRLRHLINQALEKLPYFKSVELLPFELLEQFQLADLITALRFVHHPPPQTDVTLLQSGNHIMQQRLAFEELIAHQLSLQQRRSQIRKLHAPQLNDASELRQNFLKNLGFALTAAQQRVITEIDADLSQPYPMLRLLQGDVGSGKTVVAALILLRAVAQGTQVALMAPTELLAEQHKDNFCRWLQPLGIQVSYLGGKQPAALRKKLLQRIVQGQDQVIIGTHALFQEEICFMHLTLVIIDEQHRFGVDQRLALVEKGKLGNHYPHQLIMSATPIPRTLAMLIYADLDISVIDELPPGRIPVTTTLISSNRRQQVMERVRYACQQGRQAYWVCILIEDSEVLQCQAAEATARELQVQLPELRIGLIHGRLSAENKVAQMLSFKKAEIDLLVATTVIEVGVDVPNASLMIIENSERLGLSQLHQLRGRVGRGATESYCILLFRSPLSSLAYRRLQVMHSTQDGFLIAREDLAMRGPGEVLGARQAGSLQFKVADLTRDQALLPKVHSASRYLVDNFSHCLPKLISRWFPKANNYNQV